MGDGSPEGRQRPLLGTQLHTNPEVPHSNATLVLSLHPSAQVSKMISVQHELRYTLLPRTEDTPEHRGAQSNALVRHPFTVTEYN